MTKKHFQDVAHTISIASKCAKTDEAKEAICLLAENLASDFKRINSAFKRELFLEACGLGD